MDELGDFLMIMTLELLVKLLNLIPPALESYKIRQIVHLQTKKQLKGRKEHMSTKGKTTTEFHIFTKKMWFKSENEVEKSIRQCQRFPGETEFDLCVYPVRNITN